MKMKTLDGSLRTVTESEEYIEKRMKKHEQASEICGTIATISKIHISLRRGGEKMVERIFEEIMDENIPDLMKAINLQV